MLYMHLHEAPRALSCPVTSRRQEGLASGVVQSLTPSLKLLAYLKVMLRTAQPCCILSKQRHTCAASPHLDAEVAGQACRVMRGRELGLRRVQSHRVPGLALMPAQHPQHLHAVLGA